MAISSANAAAAPATRRVETLTSGTSWTVPAGVNYVNATLIGGGGGGGASHTSGGIGGYGLGGQIVTTTVSTTPGASITYSIGAGGSGPAAGLNYGGTGGTTTFTGATPALGGNGGNTTNASPGQAGQAGLISPNGGAGGSNNAAGGAGGAGQIILEYWV